MATGGDADRKNKQRARALKVLKQLSASTETKFSEAAFSKFWTELTATAASSHAKFVKRAFDKKEDDKLAQSLFNKAKSMHISLQPISSPSGSLSASGNSSPSRQEAEKKDAPTKSRSDGNANSSPVKVTNSIWADWEIDMRSFSHPTQPDLKLQQLPYSRVNFATSSGIFTVSAHQMAKVIESIATSPLRTPHPLAALVYGDLDKLEKQISLHDRHQNFA